MNSWLFTSVAEELNLESNYIPGNHLGLVVVERLEPATSGFQVSCPSHSAMFTYKPYKGSLFNVLFGLEPAQGREGGVNQSDR